MCCVRWIVFACVLCITQRTIVGEGVFELQPLVFVDDDGRRLGGGCCGEAPPMAAPPIASQCGVACRVEFFACLKQYQRSISYSGACSFGNGTSAAQSNTNTFSPAVMQMPFSFAWTKFTLVLSVFDNVEGHEPVLVERDAFAGVLRPSATWQTRTRGVTRGGATHVARVVYRVRVRCASGFYGNTCTRVCNPRDDLFGHYTCTEGGEKLCSAGWTGDNCDKAICMEGCHPVNGNCTKPGECTCAVGWQGDFCDQCQPYPGCKHGHCVDAPLQCVCKQDWGGILCDQILDYCGTHHPCVNGGTCHPVNPGTYQCTCPPGFRGEHCQIPVYITCHVHTCLNGGTCVHAASGGHTECRCVAGFSGDRCQHVDRCALQPCINGATCVSEPDGAGYKCHCRNGWSGDFCEIGESCETAVDVSGSGPCWHGTRCRDTSHGFRCDCPAGFSGRRCQHEDANFTDNPCEKRPCANEGVCQLDGQSSSGFVCVCVAPWTGPSCLQRPLASNNSHSMQDQPGAIVLCQRGLCYVDSCSMVITSGTASGSGSGRLQVVAETAPVCGRHGRCEAIADSGRFSCQCELGFSGQYCHININDCEASPCQNGATCIDGVRNFTCACAPGWLGRLCDIKVDVCGAQSCQNGGRCLESSSGAVCACQPGWSGRHCHLRHGHCDDATCLNGGTCHELHDTFLCRCASGWFGSTCQLPRSTCAARGPCLNGATCVDTAAGKYRCQCRQGFTGPHCEENVDECAAAPCHNGATCVDGDNWFRCQCAAGFSGATCRHVITTLQRDSATCVWHGRSRAAGTTWWHECNVCRCSEHGEVSCTKVKCGDIQSCRPGSLLPVEVQSAVSAPLLYRYLQDGRFRQCQQSQVCESMPLQECLSRPCEMNGRCVPRSKTRLEDTFAEHSLMCPSSTGISCGQLEVQLTRHKMARGTSVRSLCVSIRKRLAVRLATDLNTGITLEVQCNLKRQHDNILQVALITRESEANNLLASSLAQWLMQRLNSPKSDSISGLSQARIGGTSGGDGHVVVLGGVLGACLVALIASLAAIIIHVRWQKRRRQRHLDELNKLGATDNRLRRLHNQLSADSAVYQLQQPQQQPQPTAVLKCKSIDNSAFSTGPSDDTHTIHTQCSQKIAAKSLTPGSNGDCALKPLNVNLLLSNAGACQDSGGYKYINKHSLATMKNESRAATLAPSVRTSHTTHTHDEVLV